MRLTIEAEGASMPDGETPASSGRIHGSALWREAACTLLDEVPRTSAPDGGFPRHIPTYPWALSTTTGRAKQANRLRCFPSAHAIAAGSIRSLTSTGKQATPVCMPTGSPPLFFLAYVSTCVVNVSTTGSVISGTAAATVNRCRLVAAQRVRKSALRPTRTGAPAQSSQRGPQPSAASRLSTDAR